ncbi:MAG: c-type cytochrome biogenesis protein CcmI [endosymbiont of Galathealinum brachiosum]|uniref:C-type cytochrome biogenesis protein CcmI n=1 Tax=endosymbiont of Galathealinum brachiosum TaxID=2200906 RepID=A0A370D9S8_9GAMM|nr:MAG: c-type cytochrome biogenesis protein CcmI [endosymbiont of Galathealinum brachiosum]
MISFIISAVILVLMAIYFIVPALKKKNYAFSDEYDDLNVDIAKDRLAEIKSQLEAGEINQQTFQQLHDELESTLALDLSDVPQSQSQNELSESKETSKLMPIVLAAIIPLAAAAIYYQLGDFAAATGTRIEATVIPAGEDRPEMTIEDAVAKLEQRLAEEPENPEGWFMLAKTYMTMKQYHKAVSSYEKVIEQVGEEPEVLIRYADALAMTEGGRLTGVAKPIVDKVIVLMPDSPTVLWMAGTAENQQKNFSKALTYWYKLRPMLIEDAATLAQLDQLISGAESQLSANEVAQLKKVAPAAESKVVTNAAEIIVTVELDSALKDKVSANDTLFIFAKAMQGPPMPLAAVKKTAADLPITVSLNDAMAMMPQMKLSSFDQVKISATISKSGQPGVQSGDLFVELSPVNVKSQEKIKLVINQVK